MRVTGILFLILGIFTIPMALLAMISGAYGIKGPLDVFIDIIMRLLYIGTPIGLFISGVGLLLKKRWGKYWAMTTSTILFFTCLGYGVSGLDYQGNFMFCLGCFISAFLFGATVFYLKGKNT